MAAPDGDGVILSDLSQRVDKEKRPRCLPENHRFRIRPPIHHPSFMDDPPPESIVLDAQAYLDDRTNASTAEGCTARGHRIKVTFWISHPPRVSYFTVHFPDLPEPSGKIGELPRIVRTDGDLVLLRVSVCPPGLRLRPEFNDHIIYRAGSKTLQVLPRNPDRKRLPCDEQVGLLNCHDDTGRFFVAALSSVYRRGHYKLELYDSRKRIWSTKPMYVESSQAHDYSFTSTTKVITIGGKRGSIGFVDLLQGILICDVLMGDDNILRYIRLPFLMAPNKLCRDPPTCDRDITVSQGYIKYFDMCVHAEPGSCIGTSYTSQDWEAATWKWVDSEKNWHMEYRLKASNVLVDKSHYELLPNPLHPHGPTEMKPTLSRLHVGHPALSMHDDTVYIMAKVHHMDSHKAWMLAVDMRNKTLNGVADFRPERTYRFDLTYLQSKISKHLAKRSSNRRSLSSSVEVSDYC
ncbi:hypothetical protein BRADI_3g08385v3 [Brachypodium distachyon]|uniref:DUF1618 domain-containing protein n=2 Tax=Brachypodium distachyon TaxID=15368 RepID=A0A0Q3LNL0_BRADI|nr:hypothetical protein BRADI_3g08385v3 [Brachypodium distachyon]